MLVSILVLEDDLKALKKVLDPGQVKKVWFNIQLHFVPGGNEENLQPKPMLFTIKETDSGLCTLAFNKHTDIRMTHRRRTKTVKGFLFEQPDSPLCSTTYHRPPIFTLIVIWDVGVMGTLEDQQA